MNENRRTTKETVVEISNITTNRNNNKITMLTTFQNKRYSSIVTGNYKQ